MVNRIALLFVLMYVFVGPIYSQGMPQGMMSPDIGAMMHPEAMRNQEQEKEYIQENFPEFARLKQRLEDIRKEVQSVIKDYKEESLSKDEALTRIRVLLKEEVTIKNSLEYQVEEKISSLFSRSQNVSVPFIVPPLPPTSRMPMKIPSAR